MITRADIVAEARSWIGTPFHHQAHVRGVGADCGGLVGGVAVALGLLPADWWQTTFEPAFGGYGRAPANGTLQRVCDSFMETVPRHDAQSGDVLLMRFKTEPQHLGILADYDGSTSQWSLVHALASAGCVVEHRYGKAWTLRTVAAYRYVGVV